MVDLKAICENAEYDPHINLCRCNQKCYRETDEPCPKRIYYDGRMFLCTNLEIGRIINSMGEIRGKQERAIPAPETLLQRFWRRTVTFLNNLY